MKLSADQRRDLLRHPAGWIASGFGSGLSPVAPGSAGSLAALLPWLALRELPWPLYFVVLALAFALGVWACGWVVRVLRIDDPGVAVWDEFVGQWIALAPLLWLESAWWWIAAGFILFRIFDIAKPWPVSWADRRLDGGLGVMLDDVFAGIYAAIVLVLVMHFAA
ncbi:MAG TPA: phosphatidylglycerophosphatase A [Rudaea sp.]|jgi:phosphatidylglycerophosphatase A|uniref:phosphatidylglycerophosphatase A family protein n=1 Tax=Rudaea sp. TaxID=2136325 RepID=UPI002F94DE23